MTIAKRSIDCLLKKTKQMTMKKENYNYKNSAKEKNLQPENCVMLDKSNCRCQKCERHQDPRVRDHTARTQRLL